MNDENDGNAPFTVSDPRLKKAAVNNSGAHADSDRYDVVVVGGGFAGATAVNRLCCDTPRLRVALISDRNYITYQPLLPEVVGASILPGQVIVPLRQMAWSADLFVGQMRAIDFERRSIQIKGMADGLNYEHLVLAFGSSVKEDQLPGMREHALPLKTVGDALYLRSRIIECLEQAQVTRDDRLRRRLMTFVVIGGGFCGVELAGEIRDFLKNATSYYPAVPLEICRVVLLHGKDHLLEGLSPQLGRFAFEKMRSRGIDVRLRQRVEALEVHEVKLQSGERLSAEIIICTTGNGPHPFVARLGLPLNGEGRVVVNGDLSIPGFDDVWALGDCAAVVNGLDGKPAPTTAQFAVREAAVLARNLRCRLEGCATRPFRYRAIGQVASFGHLNAVAEFFGVRLSGFCAWLLWRAVHLARFPLFSRKLRIFMAWNWEMLFKADLTDLRFDRTAWADENGDGENQ